MSSRLRSFGEYVSDTATDVRDFMIDTPGMALDFFKRIGNSDKAQRVTGGIHDIFDTMLDQTVDICRNGDKKEVKDTYEQRQTEER